MKKIGMIGIGMMGHGIAMNVKKAGYPLCVLEHSGNQPLDRLIDQGVLTYKSPKELAEHCDIIILCVTGTPQVESVLFQPDGVLEGLNQGAIIVDCSTAVPSSTIQIARQVAEKGGQFLDAAMTRTPVEAALGRLNLLVGADDTLFNEIKPLLQSFAENITHVGPVGAGHRMKLLHNYVSLGQIALLSEAAACAAKADIDPAILVDVLTKGGGGGTALNRIAPYLLNNDPSALRFTLENASKDLSYYSVMAHEADTAHQISDAVAATIKQQSLKEPSRYLPELITLLNDR